MSPDPSLAAACRWEAALGEWAIPDEILRAAPESPWHYPPRLFLAAKPSASPARRVALEALGEGGSVLDVGCGGGAAGLALVPPAHLVTGIDISPAMLANFAAATERLGVASQQVEGSWPEVSPAVEPADVVVCHHVVYNVADVAPFVVALAGHARRRVVVELTDRHPSSNLTPLWERFWGLRRPGQPTAALFVEVVRELGFDPVVSRHRRPVAKSDTNTDAYVAFVRRRLCLPAERHGEVAEALAADPAPVTGVVTVWWDTASLSSTG
jgi:SAM-dependent methyltransferase